jgi:ribose 5-phosphate isomerase A
LNHDALAAEAVREICSGMIVGLGTGRSASRAIRALAAKVEHESLKNVECVATSVRSAELARSLGLTVIPMRDCARVDLLFDGADEVDPNLAMTKGAGGAMTREKIVAESAAHRIYLVQESKLVKQLGERCPLPIEVLEFGLTTTRAFLESLGFSPTLRVSIDDDHADADGKPVRTDEGNLILDCAWGPNVIPLDLHELDHTLNGAPAIVGTGLFVTQADVVIVENDDELSRVRRRSCNDNPKETRP